MSSVAPVIDPSQVIIGVDTHKDTHTAVAVSGTGAVLDQLCFPTHSRGLAQAIAWSHRFSQNQVWAVEGTGSYGAGLARSLRVVGHTVVEINHPDQRTRRVLGGKTDRIDAEAAARSAFADHATATPKSGNGPVEQIRITRMVRNSAVKARTVTMNQLKATLVTGPIALRDDLAELRTRTLITRCARLRPGPDDTPTNTTKRALRCLARRWRLLTTEIDQHTIELTRLIQTAAPQLLAEPGIGPDSAAALLIAVGDNPHRIHSEAAFAALCGVNPIPASSGQTNRHRLNRSGDRQANAALHRIIIVRLRHHDPTRKYMANHRTPNGDNTMHIIRCLKRYLARNLHPLLIPTTTHAKTT